MITRYSGVVHGLAICDDCGWRAKSYKNALATAARHAEHYGHTVRCEQTVSVTYTPEGSEYDQKQQKRK